MTALNDALGAGVLRRSIVDTLGLHWLKILLLSLVGHTVAVGGLLVTPLEPAKMSADLFATPDRFASLVLTSPGTLAVVEVAPAVVPAAGERVTLDELRAPDRRAVLEHGVLAGLRGIEGGEASHVFGPGGLGKSIDGALGGLRGVALGTPPDAAGWAFVAPGRVVVGAVSALAALAVSTMAPAAAAAVSVSVARARSATGAASGRARPSVAEFRAR